MKRAILLAAVAIGCRGGGSSKLAQRDCDGYEALARRLAAEAVAAVRACDRKDQACNAKALEVLHAQEVDADQTWLAHTSTTPYDCFIQAIFSYKVGIEEIEGAVRAGDDPAFGLEALQHDHVAAFVRCNETLTGYGHCD